MLNPKLDGAIWTSDTRADKIHTYTETYTPEGGTEQTAEYKLIETHPIIGGILDKLAFLRTHASAVWYNKLAGITVLQKLDNIASNIGALASLLTTDKTSLVAAVNELNGKIGILENSNLVAKKFYAYTVDTGENQTIQFTVYPHCNIFCYGDRNNSPFALIIALAKVVSLTEYSTAVVDESGVVTISLWPWSTCTIFSNHPINPTVT